MPFIQTFEDLEVGSYFVVIEDPENPSSLNIIAPTEIWLKTTRENIIESGRLISVLEDATISDPKFSETKVGEKQFVTRSLLCTFGADVITHLITNETKVVEIGSILIDLYDGMLWPFARVGPKPGNRSSNFFKKGDPVWVRIKSIDAEESRWRDTNVVRIKETNSGVFIYVEDDVWTQSGKQWSSRHDSSDIWPRDDQRRKITISLPADGEHLLSQIAREARPWLNNAPYIHADVELKVEIREE